MTLFFGAIWFLVGALLLYTDYVNYIKGIEKVTIYGFLYRAIPVATIVILLLISRD